MKDRIDAARAALGGAIAAVPEVHALGRQLDELKLQMGGLEARAVAQLGPDEIDKAEFRVWSQFGEDGILQFLVQRVEIPYESEVLVEFGVESYAEANTRFLLQHDNWRALVMDGADHHVAFLEGTGLRWRQHVDPITAFVTRENINDLIRGAGIEGDIGVLSVDIDGNDYWVLDAIDCVSPRILIAEYNSVFGAEAAVTVPYDPRFVRSEKHYSYLYWGASLAALDRAAQRKGFALVASNKAGNNAFWVRRDVLGDIPEKTVAEAYRTSRYRESRGPDGTLTYLSGHRERLATIAEMPVVDVDTGDEVTVGERYADVLAAG